MINANQFIEEQVNAIKQTVGAGKVLCALSGGVDSAVTALLTHRAVGDRLLCMFIDSGLMRKDEPEEVAATFGRHFGIPLRVVPAADKFLEALRGVTEPEEKRIIIGNLFIRVFEEEAVKLGEFEYLAQGTIYPDIIESGNNGKLVKTHHNVGGLPENLKFKLVEPLRTLYKHEVRIVGRALGLPEHVVNRQPFPGPGLGIRVIGEVTAEKLAILKEADAVFREEIEKNGLSVWQYFAVLTGIKTVGVAAGERTYNYTIALRAVDSTDAMTASWVRLPWTVLAAAAEKIARIPGVGRVVYDITAKPPATIEWE
ncbi:MAG TPA: glutamine-hydrolyzing GMP synthase [Acholeplasmataceae bacterium]|jgi:GMP synthase (glutamine-hydrolysing)|nr:glutamine-hydrolyzing GMP synthase [Acholeplasmataceae bacterium]